MILPDQTNVQHRPEVINNEQHQTTAQQKEVRWCIVHFLSTQEQICGTKNLSHVTSLELCVDAREYTLGNFGKLCSRARYLRQKHDGQVYNPETKKDVMG